MSSRHGSPRSCGVEADDKAEPPCLRLIISHPCRRSWRNIPVAILRRHGHGNIAARHAAPRRAATPATPPASCHSSASRTHEPRQSSTCRSPDTIRASSMPSCTSSLSLLQPVERNADAARRHSPAGPTASPIAYPGTRPKWHRAGHQSRTDARRAHCTRLVPPPHCHQHQSPRRDIPRHRLQRYEWERFAR